MGWARASELDRVLSCVGSNRLVHLRTPSEGAQRAADWGTAVHHWKEGNDFSLDEGTERTFQKKLERVGDFRTAFWPGGQHEQAFSFNCITGAVDSRTGSRAALDRWKDSQPIECVTGTADYTDELLGMLWVDDLKTGMSCPEPDGTGQLFFYCLCLSLWETGGIEDTLSSVTHWPKYPLDGLPNRKQALLPAARLVRFHNFLMLKYAEWEKNRGEVTPGEHCLYCPALDCPSWKEFN